MSKRATAAVAMVVVCSLALIALVIAAPGATAVGQEKVFVCKYVGTPGVDERLQTGDNPISVAVTAIPIYDPNDPNHDTAADLVGDEYTDEQGRSFVLVEDTGQPEPEPGDCPPPDNPCPSGTSTTTITTTAPPVTVTETATVTTTVGPDGPAGVRVPVTTSPPPSECTKTVSTTTTPTTTTTLTTTVTTRTSSTSTPPPSTSTTSTTSTTTPPPTTSTTTTSTPPPPCVGCSTHTIPPPPFRLADTGSGLPVGTMIAIAAGLLVLGSGLLWWGARRREDI